MRADPEAIPNHPNRRDCKPPSRAPACGPRRPSSHHPCCITEPDSETDSEAEAEADSEAECQGACPSVECPMPAEPMCDEQGRCVGRVPEPPGARVQTGSCETAADCIVCETVVMGTIQCCAPCGMVTSEAQCETNRALAGDRCDAFGCPDQACASPLTPTCVDGSCAAAP